MTQLVASKGLARAKEIYQERDKRVRELHAEGKKVFGYLCIYPILEMMTALDIVPYRIFGDIREPITEADRFLTPVVCPFLRSCLDLGIKGKYDFLDGTAWSHTCDVGRHLYTLWKIAVKTPNPNYLDTPHHTHEAAVEYHRKLVGDFQGSLEFSTGKKLSTRRLKEAIAMHNQQRALVRELYDLRKPDPPLISGTETLQVVKSVMSLPVEEGSKLLREVINEVKNRKDGPPKKAGRLLIWGPVIDDASFLEMIESLDANVVMDDMCVGSRAFFPDVPVTDDPLDGLAYHYLVELKCPRTLREAIHGAFKRDYITDIEARFSYLGDYAKEWKINGVVLQALINCDIHAYEVPQVGDYFNSIGLPSIYLEHDHSEASLAPMRTRVQGLIEVIPD